MARFTFTLNGRRQRVEADPQTPLLWVLRDRLSLTGTKYGCGAGLCGACTVHIDGQAVRSCQTPISDAAATRVLTIEGLSSDGTHPLQRAWIAEGVPQCGYCQAGMILQAAALLASHPDPSEAQIESAMSGCLCRCGTYPRIRRAIRRAAREMRGGGGD